MGLLVSFGLMFVLFNLVFAGVSIVSFFCISCGLAYLQFSFAVFDAFCCVLVWLLHILVVVPCWVPGRFVRLAGGLLLVAAVMFIFLLRVVSICVWWFAGLLPA